MDVQASRMEVKLCIEFKSGCKLQCSRKGCVALLSVNADDTQHLPSFQDLCSIPTTDL